MTLIVAPKCFYDHEVIMKALMHVCVLDHRFIVVASSELRCSTPCGLGAFDALGGHCVPFRQDVLVLRYVTAVLVPCIGVCDPGGAERFC